MKGGGSSLDFLNLLVFWVTCCLPSWFPIGEPGFSGLAWFWPFLSFLQRTQVQALPPRDDGSGPSTLLLMVLTTE